MCLHRYPFDAQRTIEQARLCDKAVSGYCACTDIHLTPNVQSGLLDCAIRRQAAEFEWTQIHEISKKKSKIWLD